MGNPVVLVYSHRSDVREQIMLGVGRRPAPDLERVEFLECESVSDVLMAVDGHQADLLILDAEAQPTGGMGISRQIHMEFDAPPPVVLVVRRGDDRWLATWAKADAVLAYPLDPVTAAATVAGVLRHQPVAGRSAG
jgi:DNA-binding response OmpR family regulator